MFKFIILFLLPSFLLVIAAVYKYYFAPSKRGFDEYLNFNKEEK